MACVMCAEASCCMSLAQHPDLSTTSSKTIQMFEVSGIVANIGVVRASRTCRCRLYGGLCKRSSTLSSPAAGPLFTCRR